MVNDVASEFVADPTEAERDQREKLKAMSRQILDWAVDNLHDVTGQPVCGELGFCQAYTRDGKTRLEVRLKIDIPTEAIGEYAG